MEKSLSDLHHCDCVYLDVVGESEITLGGCSISVLRENGPLSIVSATIILTVPVSTGAPSSLL